MNLCHEVFACSLFGALDDAIMRCLKQHQRFQTSVKQICFLYVCATVHSIKSQIFHTEQSEANLAYLLSTFSFFGNPSVRRNCREHLFFCRC